RSLYSPLTTPYCPVLNSSATFSTPTVDSASSIARRFNTSSVTRPRRRTPWSVATTSILSGAKYLSASKSARTRASRLPSGTGLQDAPHGVLSWTSPCSLSATFQPTRVSRSASCLSQPVVAAAKPTTISPTNLFIFRSSTHHSQNHHSPFSFDSSITTD